MYLRRKWPEAHLQATADTAITAKRLSKKELSRDTAVLAPEGCVELYGLEILEKSVQDSKFNFTSFLAVVR